MNKWYILNDEYEIEEVTTLQWAAWNTANPDKKIVQKTEIGGYLISTVFLGLNHAWNPGEIKVFETMIFKKGFNELYMDRYGTYEEALEGHINALKWLEDNEKSLESNG